MRILWFNWRDLKHPDAGGAEVYTHAIMSRLVRRGHKFTLFTSCVEGQPEREEIEKDIDIIRNGGKFSLYRKAKEYCKSKQREYDLIIDEINAKPFIQPGLAKIPLATLFHQLIREEWFYETWFPLNYLCYHILEDRWLLQHKNTPTITVSNSSMQDLRHLGFTTIYVVQNGLNITPLADLNAKESRPTLAFIGRLKKHKLPDHALKAFQLIKEKIPNAQMWVIGDGDMKCKLESSNTPGVTFFGHVSDNQKFDLLSRVHLVLMPSIREGWGLVVTESNAMGTPVVGYNVSGLRDSIINYKTGILSVANNPAALAAHSVNLLRDRTTLQRFSEAALNHSRQYSWDKSADRFGQIIEDIAQTSPRAVEAV